MSEHEYESMRDLGKRYGISSHKIGKLLVAFGLRTVAGRTQRQGF